VERGSKGGSDRVREREREREKAELGFLVMNKTNLEKGDQNSAGTKKRTFK